MTKPNDPVDPPVDDAPVDDATTDDVPTDAPVEASAEVKKLRDENARRRVENKAMATKLAALEKEKAGWSATKQKEFDDLQAELKSRDAKLRESAVELTIKEVFGGKAVAKSVEKLAMAEARGRFGEALEAEDDALSTFLKNFMTDNKELFSKEPPTDDPSAIPTPPGAAPRIPATMVAPEGGGLESLVARYKGMSPAEQSAFRRSKPDQYGEVRERIMEGVAKGAREDDSVNTLGQL